MTQLGANLANLASDFQRLHHESHSQVGQLRLDADAKFKQLETALAAREKAIAAEIVIVKEDAAKKIDGLT